IYNHATDSPLAILQPTLFAIGASAAARLTQVSLSLEDRPYITASTTPSANGLLVTRVYSVKYSKSKIRSLVGHSSTSPAAAQRNALYNLLSKGEHQTCVYSLKMPQDPSLPRAHPKLLVRTRKAGATQTTSPARRALEAQRSQSVSKCQEYLAGWKAPIPSPASAGPRRRLDHDRAVDQRAPDEGEESGFEDGDEDEEGEDEDEEEGDDEDNEDEDDEDEELLDEYGHQAEDETNIHPELRTKKRRSDGETETETETVPSKKVKNAASGPAADAPRASVHPPSARSVLASLHDTNSPAVAALPSRTDRQPGFDEALPPSAMALLMQMCSKMDRMEQGFQRIGQVEQQLRDLKSEISGNVMNSTASATSTASSQSFTILGHADQTGQARQDEAKDSPKDYVKAESAEQYTAITGKTLASSEEMQWTKSHLRGSYAAHIGQDPLPSNKIIPLTFMMRHADGTKFTKAEVEVVTETAYALSQETEKWPDRRPISKSGKRIGNQNYRYFLKYHKAELTKLFIRLGNAHEALQYCDAERYKVKEFFMRRFKNACETSTKTEIKIEHEELALTINTARAHVKGKRTSKIIQMTSSSLDAEEAFSEDGADEGQVPGQRNRGRKPKTTAKAAKKPVPRSLDTITSDEEVTDKGE
ncbi:hypothetical protein OC834_007803, partial [Tilletia horrida]